jgi:hypothetical protein
LTIKRRRWRFDDTFEKSSNSIAIHIDLRQTQRPNEKIGEGFSAARLMIVTERRLRTRMPGRELDVQNIVNWRTIRGYDRQ